MSKALLISDNNALLGKAEQELYTTGTECISVLAKDASKLRQSFRLDEVGFAAALYKNQSLSEVTKELCSYGIRNIKILPYDLFDITGSADILPLLTEIDASKPRLDYIEIEIIEACNLKCKGCTSFCNIIDRPSPHTLEDVTRDLLKMKELFWGIEKIRLLGGEPFLNKNYADYASNAREIFPDSDIRLVSNGLLIPSLDKSELHRLREFRCSVDISLYPPTKKELSHIKAALNEAKVAYNTSPTINYFFRYLRRDGHSDPQQAFSNCLFSNCHSLNSGIFAPCCLQWTVRRYNNRFGTGYDESETVDIHSTDLDGWDIVKLCETPHKFCENCTLCPVPMRWQKDIRPSHVDDWRAPSLGILDKPAGFAFAKLKPLLLYIKASLTGVKQDKE